jgi:cytosine/adenosine deaminase-related metal-dependent hydrolase
MATEFGADALGLGDDCGTLEPGKRADFTFVQLATERHSDPYAQLLAAESVPVRTPS